MKRNVRKLDGYSSIFLDSIRLFCALIVVLGHSKQILNPITTVKGGVFDLGHGAVIIFFVISGYVIAHTTSSKRRTVNTYLVARFSRLYSIYFPAIIITLLCAIGSFIINRNEYIQFDRGYNVVRYILTLFFCNEIWFISAAPPINSPFWSLSFEFWYYILFAAIYYKVKNIRGVWIIILICLIAGPKILALFPIWCLGWLAYKLKPLDVNAFIARIIVILLLSSAIILIIALPDYPLVVGVKPLYMANAFISDTIIGTLVAASLWLLPSHNEAKLKDSLLITKFRFYANLTYPIYLFHFPLLVLCKSILNIFNLSNVANFIIGFIATLILCVVLGSYFENQKGWWYNFFRKIIYKKYPLRLFKTSL